MMEARSLASLNQLAANPPQYPINPAEVKQEPLVLYLSRVPGTRDVILSPFKPQVKNVTGEDVASSLYYVHLEMPSADHPGPRDDPTQYSGDESPTTRNIPRKPLPESARPLTPEANLSRDNLPIPNEPIRRRGLSVNSGYDASQQRRPEDPNFAPHEMIPEPKSRPIPELMAPLQRRPTVLTGVTGPRPMTSPGPNPPPPSIANKVLPPLPSVIDDMYEPPRPRHSREINRSPSPRKFHDSTYSTPFTLTLIRRDPSTGNQWNVGKISSYQADAPNEMDASAAYPVGTTSTPSSGSTGRPPINISLETLGYSKFRHMPKRAVDTSPTGIRDVIASMSKDTTQPKHDPRNDPPKFTRQVVMGYSKSWASNLKDKWHQMEQNRSAYTHGRQSSVGSFNSTNSSEEQQPQDIVGQPGPGMKPRGYVFASPWDGRCEFRTGNAGRSVRLYHILHEDNPSFNPLVGNPQNPSNPTVPQSGTIPVSELRFNLPSSELFKTPEGRRDAKAQLQGHFNKLLKRGQRDDDSDDYEDGTVSPFDMNLGRERAGGGNRGKRAKLGKLIINNDGLKMLDLVVAANMGLWWGAWERSF